jgi:hypothetical protein
MPTIPNNRLITSSANLTVPVGAVVYVVLVEAEDYTSGPGFPWLTPTSSNQAVLAPGVVGLVLGDPDQQQREPAEQHVRADLVFFAVMDGAQVQRGLHVAPGALDLEQLLVAEREVLGCQGFERSRP